MSTKIPVHIKVGLILAFLVVTYPKGLLHPIHPGSEDSPERYLQRFAPAREVLPSHGVVGFIADFPSEEIQPSLEYSRRWYLTQYSMNPLIVLNSTRQDNILGDVRNPEALERIKASGKFAIIQDFGEGVFLFRRIGK
jgi:hypothetical protein